MLKKIGLFVVLILGFTPISAMTFYLHLPSPLLILVPTQPRNSLGDINALIPTVSKEAKKAISKNCQFKKPHQKADMTVDMYQFVLAAHEAHRQAENAKKNDDETSFAKWSDEEQRYLCRISFCLAHAANPNYRPKPIQRSQYKRPIANPTPLMLAARYGYYDVAEALIAKGANLNMYVRGTTALIEAIGHNRKKVAKLLLDRGARIDIGPWRATAVHEAIRLSNFSMLHLLLENCENAANVTGRSEILPLISAINLEVVERFEEGVLELIDKGADVNVNANTGFRTPLHRATLLAKKRIVEALIDKGARDTPHNGEFPVERAILKGVFDIASVLLPK